MPPVKTLCLACRATGSMANHTKAGPAYTISGLDSPIQNTTLGVVAISIALATLIVAYLHYKRSASREHPTVAVEQERPVPPSNGIPMFISTS